MFDHHYVIYRQKGSKEGVARNPRKKRAVYTYSGNPPLHQQCSLTIIGRLGISQCCQNQNLVWTGCGLKWGCPNAYKKGCPLLEGGGDDKIKQVEVPTLTPCTLRTDVITNITTRKNTIINHHQQLTTTSFTPHDHHHDLHHHQHHHHHDNHHDHHPPPPPQPQT